MSKKYKAAINNLYEAGIPHAKGQEIKVPLTEERAINLLKYGYIEEVVESKEEVIPEVKNYEVPQKKVITTEPNANGLTAKLKAKAKK